MGWRPEVGEPKKSWQGQAELRLGAGTIRDVVDAVLHQLARLAVSPQEVRVEFGLELTAKAAALVASASATAQLRVTLAWNPTHHPSTQPTQG